VAAAGSVLAQAPDAAPPTGQTVSFSESSFDKTNFDQLTVIGARKKCEDTLAASIALVDQAAALTDGQRSKLELAGQLDIHRFFDRYASSKRELRFGALPLKTWQAQIAEAEKRLLPLRTGYAEGLHRHDSLFDKTLSTALDEAQYQRVQEMFRQRTASTYANYIRITLAMLDRKVPLSVAQRHAITQRLLANTQPPETYGTGSLPIHQVLSQLAKIDSELPGILSPAELAVIRQLIESSEAAQARGEVLP
jgi:hypothetical protein